MGDRRNPYREEFPTSGPSFPDSRWADRHRPPPCPWTPGPRPATARAAPRPFHFSCRRWRGRNARRGTSRRPSSGGRRRGGHYSNLFCAKGLRRREAPQSSARPPGPAWEAGPIRPHRDSTNSPEARTICGNRRRGRRRRSRLPPEGIPAVGPAPGRRGSQPPPRPETPSVRSPERVQAGGRVCKAGSHASECLPNRVFAQIGASSNQLSMANLVKKSHSTRAGKGDFGCPFVGIRVCGSSLGDNSM